MRSLFASALLALGVCASDDHKEEYDAIPIEVGGTPYGTIKLQTQWSKPTTGSDAETVLEYAYTIERNAAYQALTTKKKITVWWTKATDATQAEVNIIEELHTSNDSNVFYYSYGTTAVDAVTPQVDSVTAFTAPAANIYKFLWSPSNVDPVRFQALDAQSPVSNTYWAPNADKSRNSATQLNMFFNRSLQNGEASVGVAEIANNGATVKFGVIWKADADLVPQWSEGPVDVKWHAEHSGGVNPGGGGDGSGAMMLAQTTLAAGAALIAAFSF